MQKTTILGAGCRRLLLAIVVLTSCTNDSDSTPDENQTGGFDASASADALADTGSVERPPTDGSDLSEVDLSASGEPSMWSLVADLPDGPSRPAGELVATFDRERGELVAYGSPGSEHLFFAFDGSDWRTGEGGHQWRRNGGIAYQSARQRTVAFGGFYGSAAGGGAVSFVFLDELWVWDGTEPAQVQRSGDWPTGRAYLAMAHDSEGERTVVFGGCSSMQDQRCRSFLDDTWEFDGSDWAQIDSPGPPPRMGSSMAFDSARERVVLFGGQAAADARDPGALLSDTWEYYDSVWHRVDAPTGPPNRTLHSLIYIDSWQTVLLFGGFSGSRDDSNNWRARRLADIWVWTGAVWVEVETEGPGPSGLQGAAVAYDSTGDRLLIGGGYTGSENLSDVWALALGDMPDLSGAGPDTGAEPSCNDGRRNGNETAPDCGGDCAGCPHGASCDGGSDCRSGSCSAGVCRCVPQCSCSHRGLSLENECGDDGCGGTCGQCFGGEVCYNGSCKPPGCVDACDEAIAEVGCGSCSAFLSGASDMGACQLSAVDDGLGGVTGCQCYSAPCCP